MQNKSQRYANLVLKDVQKIATDKSAEKYRLLTKKAGSLVRNSGLLQTIAFFESKGEEHSILFEYLENELRTLGILGNSGLKKHAVEKPLPEYMRLTRETLHLLNWHKRFAETLIKKRG